MSNPFEKLSPEEQQSRINAAQEKLQNIELEDIVSGDVVPTDLPQPDLYSPATDDMLLYRPEDWEQ